MTSPYSDYGDHLAECDRLLACDKHGDWGKAIVKRVARRDGGIKLRVHFVGWDAIHDEWIAVGDDRLRPSPRSRSRLGRAALQRQLKLQWAEGEWYKGTVTRFDGDNQMHLVVFEDGDSDWYHLDVEESNSLLKWMDGPRGSSSAPTAKSARTVTTPAAATSTATKRAASNPQAVPATVKSAERNTDSESDPEDDVPLSRLCQMFPASSQRTEGPRSGSQECNPRAATEAALRPAQTAESSLGVDEGYSREHTDPAASPAASHTDAAEARGAAEEEEEAVAMAAAERAERQDASAKARENEGAEPEGGSQAKEAMEGGSSAGSVDNSFGVELRVGDRCMAQDSGGFWCAAKVLAVATKAAHAAVQVHFIRFKSRHDEWIRIGKGRLRADPEAEADRKPARKRKRAAAPAHPVAAPPVPVAAPPTPSDLQAKTTAAMREAALGVRPRSSDATRHGVRPSTFGEGACGKRVAIVHLHAQGKPVWYSATVAQFREADQRHSIAYDDGTQAWLHLDDEMDAEQLQWHQPRTRCETAAHTLPKPTAASDGDISAWLPPLLCDWSYTSEGKLTGRVFGKRGYKDGTIMTTSAVSRANRFQTHATTESGTVYLLGPQLKTADAAAAPSDLSQRTLTVDERHKEERRNSCRSSESAVKLECSICRDLCELSETDWDVTACGHAFHEACLLRWVTHHSLGGSEGGGPAQAGCPNCRHPLSSSRLRLFDKKDPPGGPGLTTYYLKDNLGVRQTKGLPPR